VAAVDRLSDNGTHHNAIGLNPAGINSEPWGIIYVLMRSDFRFHYDIRVRFADTDLQGIVFNGNYLTYYDVAWTEYFRELGFSYKDLIERGADTVLARTTLEFKSPGRFDDILEVHTRVSSIGNSSLIFDFEIYPAGADTLIGGANSLYVCVDPKTLKKIRVPEFLRDAIARFEGREFRTQSL
jgi:acyl-CoA thioester hydrolase